MVWFFLPGGDIPVVLVLSPAFKTVSELLFHVWSANHLPVQLFSFCRYKWGSPNCVSLLYDSQAPKLAFCVSRVIWTMSGILSNRKSWVFSCLNQGHIKNHNTYFQLSFQLLTTLLLYFYPQSWFFLE